MGKHQETAMVRNRLVRDVMTAPVRFVSPATPLADTLRILNEARISGLAVCNEAGQLVGEISAKDLMVRESGVEPGPYVVFLDSVIYLRNPLRWEREVHRALGETAGDVMNRHPHTCSTSLTLRAAARQLHGADTERLFVVEGGRPQGVISRTDLIRAMAADI